MNCLGCGKHALQGKTIALVGEARRERFEVRMAGLECPNCGYKTVEGRGMPTFMRLVADEYRKKHELLTSEQLIARRKHLGMSQAEFAAYLQVGEASVKRWELGSIQDKAMNQLIELMTDPVRVAEHLGALERRLGRTGEHLSRSTAKPPMSLDLKRRGSWVIVFDEFQVPKGLSPASARWTNVPTIEGQSHESQIPCPNWVN
jgi:putative zinc finger/helix-turn-helix YgiT family protein